jgi:hypothetical protein
LLLATSTEASCHISEEADEREGDAREDSDDRNQLAEVGRIHGRPS